LEALLVSDSRMGDGGFCHHVLLGDVDLEDGWLKVQTMVIIVSMSSCCSSLEFREPWSSWPRNDRWPSC
jgi:hypothetical protein